MGCPNTPQQPIGTTCHLALDNLDKSSVVLYTHNPFPRSNPLSRKLTSKGRTLGVGVGGGGGGGKRQERGSAHTY